MVTPSAAGSRQFQSIRPFRTPTLSHPSTVNGLGWITIFTFPVSGNPVVVTDRERHLSQEFWARRGQRPRAGRSFSGRRRVRLQPRERIFVAIGIAAAVMVVVMGVLR